LKKIKYIKKFFVFVFLKSLNPIDVADVSAQFWRILTVVVVGSNPFVPLRGGAHRHLTSPPVAIARSME
jgi:hypothetical protein